MKCINLLGDADSTGAIAGQIAGSFYGYDNISNELIQFMEQWDNGDVALRGALLYAMGNNVQVVAQGDEKEEVSKD